MEVSLRKRNKRLNPYFPLIFLMIVVAIAIIIITTTATILFSMPYSVALAPKGFVVNANNSNINLTHILTLKIIHTFPNGTQQLQFPNGTIVKGTPPSQAQIQADIAKHD